MRDQQIVQTNGAEHPAASGGKKPQTNLTPYVFRRWPSIVAAITLAAFAGGGTWWLWWASGKIVDTAASWNFFAQNTLSLFIFCGVVAQALIYISQRKLMYEQREVMEKQWHVMERQWAGVVEGARPYLDIRLVLTSGPNQQSGVNLWLGNNGNSAATVSLHYDFCFTGDFEYQASGQIKPFEVSPGKFEERRVPLPITHETLQEIGTRHTARFVARLKGKYSGVGGPWKIDWCREWGQGTVGMSFGEIGSPCEEKPAREDAEQNNPN